MASTEEVSAKEVENEGRRAQEIAASCEGFPPENYIQNEINRPVLDPPAVDVPVIDVGLLCRPEGEGERSKLRSALQNWGLFQAVGHGVPASLLDEVWRMTREFFSLPMQVKEMYGGAGREGYGNDDVVAERQVLDWSDRLYLLTLPEDQRKPELWPETPSYFREALHEYTEQTRLLIEQILKAMAGLLGLDERYFIDQLGEKAANYTRFNYYPPCPRPDLVLGIKSHADASALTIVLPDQQVEGLQVLRDGGHWVKVPVIPKAFLVNVGDQMEIMTNGLFKSPVHRVVVSKDSDRISVAMFYSAEAEREIGPAPGSWGEDRPRMYKDVRLKDYLRVFYEDFPSGRRSIYYARNF